jgi:hypothetical protein
MLRKAARQHVEVAGLACGTPQPAETFREPIATLGRNQGVESLDSGQRATRRDA